MKAIEIKNLSYIYPAGSPDTGSPDNGKTGLPDKALEDINLDVFPAECIGIIGPNGAGKTTLLLHLNGILFAHPASGGSGGQSNSVKILGMSVNNKTLKEIRKKVGIVFQNPDDQLFMPTVFDDVSFGILNLGMSDVEKRVNDILQKIGLSGYEDKITHHLSFGEKKRISLATVLVMGPEILVLDEPTSGLDPASRREFIELIKSFNCTKIIASHDIGMIYEVSNKVVVLNQGKKIIEGPTKDILNNRDLLIQNRLL